MSASENADSGPSAPAERASPQSDTGPKVPAGGAPPRQKGRRRPAMRWIVHGVLFVALAAGVFGVLPLLGGLTRDAAGLRHARPALVTAAMVAQAVSLGCYALLYRRVLASLGARLRFRLAAEVTLASFLVSHVTPFGSATGTLLNVSTLEAEGIAASTTGEAIGLTSLVSAAALIALFGAGLVATAGRHISQSYLMIAGIALALVVAVLAIALWVGAHPASPNRRGAGRRDWRGASGRASTRRRWAAPAGGSCHSHGPR
jgi:uncharacterized membrane protein YbhN (UPF0104 family)